MPSRTLVDRESQLAALGALAADPGPRLGLLYGRRRVGKTFLLDNAWPDHRIFYFLAADSTPDLNRLDFLREVAAFAQRELNPADFPTWRTVFRLLVDLAAPESLVVVIDEFQYVLGGDDDAASQLVAVWDVEVRGTNLTIVLCGSELDTMSRLREADQPLHGRFDWSHRLMPFDYFDARQMLPERPLREAMEAYGIFGGTPLYLAQVQPDGSLSDEACRTMLEPDGPIRYRVENLIEQEKGIRKPGEYRAVLSAIARGRTERNEIAGGAGLQDRPETVRHILSRLQDLQFVRSETNFAAPANAPVRYRIADNAVRFWYRFIDTNRSALEMGDAGEIWDAVVAPGLGKYMGSVFETVAKEGYARKHAAWGLDPAVEWARWEGLDRDRRPVELDIVARLTGGRLLIGEVKWSSRPVDASVHTGVLRKLESLAASGYGWAHEALPEREAATYMYVSAAGFEEAFVDLARERGDTVLISLEDLYEE